MVGKLILVSGASGAGKTSIINCLVDNFSDLYVRPKSYTTRDIRKNESYNEYDFVKQQWLVSEYNAGNLLNFDYVYGNYYAISKRSISAILDKGKIAIKEIHPMNYKIFEYNFPNLTKVYIKTSKTENYDKERSNTDHEYYSRLNENTFDIIINNNWNKSIFEYSKQLHLEICKLFEEEK